MMSDYELRNYAACRADASEDGKRIHGYAIVFHAESQDLGGFKEYIAPEAVDRSLNTGADIRALVDHDSGKIIGRTRAGTLSLRKDTRGLKVTIEPDPEISYAGDVLRAVKRGDISGMSFGFRALEDEWNFEGKIPIRTVTDMEIREVSIVAFPAYTQTDVQVAMRSLDAHRDTLTGPKLAWLERWHKTRIA